MFSRVIRPPRPSDTPPAGGEFHKGIATKIRLQWRGVRRTERSSNKGTHNSLNN